VASGERTVKSGGCPGASGRDANQIAGVSGPGWRAGGATTSLSELKSLTQNPRLKGVGRPCYEAENSACRGEWRRESGSPQRAPNAGPGGTVPTRWSGRKAEGIYDPEVPGTTAKKNRVRTKSVSVLKLTHKGLCPRRIRL
jgi:hypothetical protein